MRALHVQIMVTAVLSFVGGAVEAAGARADANSGSQDHPLSVALAQIHGEYGQLALFTRHVQLTERARRARSLRSLGELNRKGDTTESSIGDEAFMLTWTPTNGKARLVWMAYAASPPIQPLPVWTGAVTWVQARQEAYVVLVTSRGSWTEWLLYRAAPESEAGEWPCRFDPERPDTWPVGARPVSTFEWHLPGEQRPVERVHLVPEGRRAILACGAQERQDDLVCLRIDIDQHTSVPVLITRSIQ